MFQLYRTSLKIQNYNYLLNNLKSNLLGNYGKRYFSTGDIKPDTINSTGSCSNINIQSPSQIIGEIKKINVVGMTKDEMRSKFMEFGLAKFVGDQVSNWIYTKSKFNFDEMHNISKASKEILNQNFKIDIGTVKEDQISVDGTRKFLLEFGDGNKVECVFIPEMKRGTLCVSSQVGCTFSCTFCHTGTQKLVRNLTSSEIVSQVLQTRRLLQDFELSKERILTNVVFMGQGEPFYNYRNVVNSIRLITDSEGIGIGRPKITVSTSGVVPLITRLGDEVPNVGLAISLHATTDIVRSEIVPCNRQWPLQQLVKACQDFKSKFPITLEYVMLKGVNDSLDDAERLYKLSKQFKSFINLIPFNPWPGSNYECSSNNTIDKFANHIEEKGTKVTIRQPRGRDILAACGTLKTNSVKSNPIIKPQPGPPSIN